MKKSKLIFLTLMLLGITSLLIISCKNKRFISKNIITDYNPKKHHDLFSLKVFHNSNDSSKLFLKLPLNIFTKEKNDEMFSVGLKLSISSSGNKPEIIYSESKLIETNFEKDKRHLTSVITFPFSKNKKGILYLKITNNENVIWENRIDIDKTSNSNRQFFNVLDKENNQIWNNFLSVGDSFKIEVSPLITTKILKVKYFKPFEEISRPPYLGDDLKRKKLKPDSTFTINVHESKTQLLSFSEKGVYHFLAEESNREGFTLCKFYEDYPRIVSHEQMYLPLRYITANREFKQILNSNDKIKSIENFWTFISSNKESARERIKEYYSRVNLSNTFFTSHQEGWQTDRGMIYIVLGPPNLIYKQTYREIWIYGDEKYFGSISFDFIQVLNPLSENDYILKRNPSYKEVWTTAIDMWRR